MSLYVLQLKKIFTTSLKNENSKPECKLGIRASALKEPRVYYPLHEIDYLFHILTKRTSVSSKCQHLYTYVKRCILQECGDFTWISDSVKN